MSEECNNESLKNFQKIPVEDLYIHIPFCKQVCSYCDFCVLQCGDILTTRNSRQASFIKPYLESLQNEIISIGYVWQRANLVKPLKSIYIGGGTPSALQTDELANILKTCRNIFPIADNCEVTMELNPNHYKHLDFAYLGKLGLNRVSIGLQTCDAKLLEMLRREHSYEDVQEAVQAIRSAGITNYSLDLIIALPGQDLSAVHKDLDLALALAPEHISIYSLILEAGSKLYWQYQHGDKVKMLDLPNEDLEREMMHFATLYLEKCGFRHYEISNFARSKKRESRHNTAVWLARPYFGFGLNASSYLAGIRRTNTKQINRYIELWQSSLSQPLLNSLDFMSVDLYKSAMFTDANDEDSAMEDYFAFALRYLQGVKCADFCTYFQKNIPIKIKQVLEKAVKLDLLQIANSKEIESNSILYVTSKGQDYLDEISRNLLGCLH